MQKILGDFFSNANFNNLIWILLLGFFFIGLFMVIKRFVLLSKLNVNNFHQSLRNFLKTYKINNSEYIIYHFEQKLSAFSNKGNIFIKFFITSLPLLGLLGTFIGLIKSVVESMKILDNADSLVNISKITDGISISFDGISFAFLTTIIGISGSIILLFINNLYLRLSRKKISTLTNEVLPKLIEEFTKTQSIKIAESIFDNIKTYFTDSMKSFGKTVSDSFIGLESWSENIIQTQTSAIVENTKNSNERIDKILDQLKAERSVLKIMKDNWKQSIDLLRESSDKILVTSKAFSKFNKPYEELVNTIDDFAERFNDLFVQINNVVKVVSKPNIMFDNIATALSTNSNLNKKMIDEQAKTQKILLEFDSKIENVIKRMVDKQIILTESLQNENQKVNNKMIQELEQVSDSITTLPEIFSSRISKSFGINAKQLGSTLSKINDLENIIVSSIKDSEIENKIENVIKRMLDKQIILTESLQNENQRVNNKMIQELEQVSVNLSDSITTLSEKFSSRISNSFEINAKQLGSILSELNNLENVIVSTTKDSEIENKINEILNSLKTLDKLNTNLGNLLT